MDGDERRHRQYGQLPYQVPHTAPANATQQMPPPLSTSERYAVSPVRADRSSLSRPQMSGYGGYAFSEHQYSAPAMQTGPMQGVEMQYSPTYGHDISRQQQLQQQTAQQQQYSQYGANVSLQPTSSQSSYDPIPQMQQRQSAAEVMANQFGMPQYMNPGGQGGMAPTQYMTSQPEQPMYQPQPPPARPPTTQSYPAPSTQISNHPQQYSQEAQAPASTQDLERDMRQYQQHLKQTFDLIRAGRVKEAGKQLIRISRWLLDSVVVLGLHLDVQEEHTSRLEMWREFNLCWEALGLKQKDITEEALRLRRDPPEILTTDELTSMGTELCSLCDGIAQHGLVDYDMGVWEEQILHVFGQCLDLLPADDSGGQIVASDE